MVLQELLEAARSKRGLLLSQCQTQHIKQGRAALRSCSAHSRAWERVWEGALCRGSDKWVLQFSRDLVLSQPGLCSGAAVDFGRVLSLPVLLSVTTNP